MLEYLIPILIFTLFTFIVTLILYPFYIKFLKKLKAWKKIRETAGTGEKSTIFIKLHWHKAGVPTMWGGLFLLVMLIMVGISLLLQHFDWITHSLWNQQETYIILFWFFSMGVIGLVDDILNVRDIGKIKGLNIKAKMFGMVLFSAWIAYRFYRKLGIDYINLRPFADKIEIWLFSPLLVFISTITIVNAINITDGLDGLAGGMSSVLLVVLAVATFLNQTYIATTVLWVCVAMLIAFMFYNMYPAKVFMGDSGAFALGGIVAATLHLLNMRIWIFIPFCILFALFMLELCSSGLQMTWKKVFKRKLFPIAPFHHYLERKGMPECSIVMRLWFVQGILALAAIVILMGQYM